MTGQYGKIFPPRHCARLLLIVEHGGDPMMARIAMLRALHRSEPWSRRLVWLSSSLELRCCSSRFWAPWRRALAVRASRWAQYA